MSDIQPRAADDIFSEREADVLEIPLEAADDQEIPNTHPFTANEFLAAVHDAMPPVIELEYVAGLRRFASIWSGRVYKKASVCAGTEIRVKFDQALWDFYAQRYGIIVEVEHAWASEIKQSKKEFIGSQFPELKLMIGDMAALAGDSVINDFTGSEELVPETHSLSAGVPCISRTPQSCAMAKNLNCVQEKREATGSGFEHIRSIAQKHSPDEVTLECVTQLCQKAAQQSVSDADYMTESFRELGYWGLHHTMDSEQHGGWPRIREWWVNAKHLSLGSTVEISRFYLSLLAHIKLPKGHFDVTRCITIDDEQRRREGQALGIPLIMDQPERESKKPSVNKLDAWKLTHYSLFQTYAIDWPADKSKFPHICFSGMFDREAEVVILCDIIFAPRSVMEFMDINPTVDRLLQGCIDEETGIVKKSPWRATPPTLTGSTKLAIRMLVDTDTQNNSLENHEPPAAYQRRRKIRLAEGFEYFRLQGWDDSMWTPVQPSDLPDCPMDYIELLSNLAGNGWSAFHYIPVQMSLLATIGRYHKGLDPSVPCIQEALEEDSEEAECSSDLSFPTASDSD